MSGNQLVRKADIDISGIVDVILGQPEIGAVIKVNAVLVCLWFTPVATFAVPTTLSLTLACSTTPAAGPGVHRPLACVQSDRPSRWPSDRPSTLYLHLLSTPPRAAAARDSDLMPRPASRFVVPVRTQVAEPDAEPEDTVGAADAVSVPNGAASTDGAKAAKVNLSCFRPSARIRVYPFAAVLQCCNALCSAGACGCLLPCCTAVLCSAGPKTMLFAVSEFMPHVGYNHLFVAGLHEGLRGGGLRDGGRCGGRDSVLYDVADQPHPTHSACVQYPALANRSSCAVCF